MAATTSTQSKKSTTSAKASSTTKTASKSGKFPSFPTFPSIDFSAFDVTKLDPRKFEMPKFEMPTFEMPTFEMPKFEIPGVDLPNVDLPAVDTETITNAAKDVVYISVGVAVLAVQKAQELGRDVTKAFNEQYGSNKPQIDEFIDAIDSRLVDAEGKWNSAVEDFGQRLPEPVSTLLEQAHDAAKTARHQLRSKVVPAAA